MIIGLTGGTGSGKSTVADILREMGIYVVDCDKIGHDVIAPGGVAEQEVIRAFGDEIVVDGQISRKKLGDIVFSDEEKRRILNAITHKHIKSAVIQETQGKSPAVIDGALLVESGIHTICDRLWVVVAPEELRMKRIMERDGISREAARRRILSQADENVLTNLADVVIMNDGSREDLCDIIERII